jgi:DNA-binding NarL/FixJ family response regulator
MTVKARLLLADGDVLMVEAFSELLEPEFEVVGTVTNGFALLDEAARLKPDVVVLDLDLPKLNGRDAGKEIHKMLPRTKIVVVTNRDDFQSAAQSLDQWASAYLLKRSKASELIQAIREVLNEKAYVTPCVAHRLFEEFVRNLDA